MKKLIGQILMLSAIFYALAVTDAQAWPWGKKRFQHADKNKDGRLEPAEIRKEKNWERDQRVIVDKAWEKKADVNQDGKVGVVELRAYRRQLMDTNGDGRITVEERQTFWLNRKAVVNTPVEQRFDLNHDGIITGDEAKKMMEALLIVIKTDGKAKVNTVIEQEFDTNHDGLIDSTEAEGLKEALGEN